MSGAAIVGTLFAWAPACILSVTAAVMILRDPRRMRCAIFTGLALSQILLTLGPIFFGWAETVGGGDVPYAQLALLLFAFLLVLAVAAFLIWAGLVLVLREGASVPHLLSLALGVGILLYVGLGAFTALRGALLIFTYLVLLVFPVATFSFVLFSYLFYSGLYGLWVRRWATPGEVVVVLGSGLIGEEVPPLLARRLDLGVVTYVRAQVCWPRPLLVVSGGKGSDEDISEAEGMARYIQARNVPGVELVLETQSASTEQNIRFTKEIVEARGINGPWTAVTSDFHAFRAAMLLSEQNIAGNAVGARSVRYFWASAKLRELIAILAQFPRWTAAVTVISSLPLLAAVLVRLVDLVGGAG